MNKVEKIKAEIERRKDDYMAQATSFEGLGVTERTAYYSTLASNMASLIRYIDSLSDTEKDFGIKESVIPFGASDSELMETTYFIPQGYHAVIDGNKVIIKKGEEPVSNDLEEVANSCSSCIYLEEVLSDDDKEVLKERLVNTFKAGAQWQKENLWKNAQGDDLPEIDREVIVLARALPEHEDSLLKVAFAHRPPEYWEGKNIGTGEITRYEPMRYDKGQWNIPAVVWWLDVKLPKEEE